MFKLARWHQHETRCRVRLLRGGITAAPDRQLSHWLCSKIAMMNALRCLLWSSNLPKPSPRTSAPRHQRSQEDWETSSRSLGQSRSLPLTHLTSTHDINLGYNSEQGSWILDTSALASNIMGSERSASLSGPHRSEWGAQKKAFAR